MKKVLVIAPLVDIPTITSNLLVGDILDYIDTKFDWDADLLWGPAANNIAYNWKTKKKQYDAIFYIGHSEKDRLMGTYMGWFSMINKKNIHRAKDSIIITMACYSGKELAPEAIKKGVRGYIGAVDVIFANFPEKEHNFLADWRDSFSSYFRAIIDGKTVKEAHEVFQGKMDYYIRMYEQLDSKKNYDWYETAAKHNKNALKYFGDPNAKVM